MSSVTSTASNPPKSFQYCTAPASQHKSAVESASACVPCADDRDRDKAAVRGIARVRVDDVMIADAVRFKIALIAARRHNRGVGHRENAHPVVGFQRVLNGDAPLFSAGFVPSVCTLPPSVTIAERTPCCERIAISAGEV